MNQPVSGTPGRYWHALEDGRIQCDVCPHYCKLHEGQRGTERCHAVMSSLTAAALNVAHAVPACLKQMSAVGVVAVNR